MMTVPRTSSLCSSSVVTLHTEPIEIRHSPHEVLRLLGDMSRPVALCGAWAGGGALITSEPAVLAGAEDDPFDTVDRLPKAEATGPVSPKAVGGGWFGYLSYRLGRRLEKLRTPEPSGSLLPDFSLAYYDHLLRYDRDDDRWYYEALVSDDRREALDDWRQRVLALLAQSAPPQRSFALGPMRSPHPTKHIANVEHTVAAIRRGDIFQANVCTRLAGSFEGSTAEAWAAAAERLNPARSAYLSSPDGALLSLSPELFLHRADGRVTTAPIKGTRPRVGSDDQALLEAEVLADSAKDSAENIMIVDLMRNDLGRVCSTGTVTTPELLSVEPHPGVWHLVSYVVGELPDDHSNASLLRATFPPGSVTGAPKLRAMEIVDGLETANRGVYTGAIGYVSPLAGVELSVCIRTLEVSGARAELGVGGGITVDSTPIEEWQECLVKAEPLLNAWGSGVVDAEGAASPGRAQPDLGAGVFETLLCVDGVPLEVADHCSRLRRSCWEVYRVTLSPDLERSVYAACVGHDGRQRVRILVEPGSQPQITVQPLPFAGPAPVTEQPGLVGILTEAPGGLERHKFADRRELEAAEAGKSADEVVAFHDGFGSLLETTRDALFLVRAGQLVTAPLDGRILPGVTRRIVLDLAEDHGIETVLEHLRVEQLADAGIEGAFVANSLRGIRWLRSLGDLRWSGPDELTSLLSEALRERWNLTVVPAAKS